MTLPTPAEQDAKRAAYEADLARVNQLLAAPTVDVEKLRPFAQKRYDSWCEATRFGQCGCCYCVARRRLAELERAKRGEDD